jgi:hypothetical protein
VLLLLLPYRSPNVQIVMRNLCIEVKQGRIGLVTG